MPLHDFRVGDWLVRPGQNLVIRAGTTLHLRPKVMDVLIVLAERPGEVVAGEAILEAVWGKRFLARSALASAVCELREVLGDDPQRPRYIETLAKRGYRLALPATPAGAIRKWPDARGREGPPSRATERGGTARWRRSLLIVTTGLATVAAVAVAIVAGREAPSPPHGPRVVVLPFDNLGDSADDGFVAALGAEVMARLARLRTFTVVTPAGSDALLAASRPGDVGPGSRGDYALVGSVRSATSGGHRRVRVTARLVRAGDAAVLWADVYEGSADDVLNIHAEISRRVAAALDDTLKGDRRE